MGLASWVVAALHLEGLKDVDGSSAAWNQTVVCE
jgi:hypothetical protein